MQLCPQTVGQQLGFRPRLGARRGWRQDKRVGSSPFWAECPSERGGKRQRGALLLVSTACLCADGPCCSQPLLMGFREPGESPCHAQHGAGGGLVDLPDNASPRCRLGAPAGQHPGGWSCQSTGRLGGLHREAGRAARSLGRSVCQLHELGLTQQSRAPPGTGESRCGLSGGALGPGLPALLPSGLRAGRRWRGCCRGDPPDACS